MRTDDLLQRLKHCERKIVRIKREAKRVYGPAWRYKSLHFRLEIARELERARRIRQELESVGG